MVESSLRGWPVDLPRLYGPWAWKRREGLSLCERLWTVPGRDMALVLYDIGEVGVGKQVGRVAVLANRAAPRPVYRPGKLLFWDLHDQTFRFSEDGGIAYGYEHGEVRLSPHSNPSSLTARLRGLDLDRGLVGRLPHDSATFDLAREDLAALVWKPWPTMLPSWLRRGRRR